MKELKHNLGRDRMIQKKNYLWAGWGLKYIGGNISTMDTSQIGP